MLRRRSRLPVAFGSAGGRKTDELKVSGSVRVGERQWAFVEPLDEVDLPLVLPGFRGFDGPSLPGEGHVPALVFGILESCVVVLQDYLCEDTVSASPIGLWVGREGGKTFNTLNKRTLQTSEAFLKQAFHYIRRLFTILASNKHHTFGVNKRIALRRTRSVQSHRYYLVKVQVREQAGARGKTAPCQCHWVTLSLLLSITLTGVSGWDEVLE